MPSIRFVFLNGGTSHVITIRSVTSDCFLPGMTELNMKCASDRDKAILSSCGPFISVIYGFILQRPF